MLIFYFWDKMHEGNLKKLINNISEVTKFGAKKVTLL